MNIKTITSHTVTFSIQYFQETEGGMIRGHYGHVCQDIASAIELLRLAKIHSGDDWMIVCDVETHIGSEVSQTLAKPV